MPFHGDDKEKDADFKLLGALVCNVWHIAAICVLWKIMVSCVL